MTVKRVGVEIGIQIECLSALVPRGLPTVRHSQLINEVYTDQKVRRVERKDMVQTITK